MPEAHKHSENNDLRRSTQAIPHPLPTDTCQDHDLAAVVDAWPELPGALRAGILAMVKAASGTRGGGS